MDNEGYLAQREMQQYWLRYAKLRQSHWSDGPETLVVVRAKDVPGGVQTYAGSRLDEAVDQINIKDRSS